MLLHFMNQSKDGNPRSVEQLDPAFAPTEYELESRIAESCEMVSTSYGVFKSRAAEQVTWEKPVISFLSYLIECASENSILIGLENVRISA